MKNPKLLITACLYALIGALFIIMKGNVLNILMTIIGAGLIIWGIIDIVNKYVVEGIIKIIVGIALILVGWLAVAIVLYILGIVLIVYGAITLYEVIKRDKRNTMRYVEPVLLIIAGILLLFAQGTAVNVIFIICGVILIIDAILMAIAAFQSKPAKKTGVKSSSSTSSKKSSSTKKKSSK